MFTLRALKRQGTRVLVSFVAHSICKEIAGIVADLSGSVIDTPGLMAHYAPLMCLCIAGKDDQIIRYVSSSEESFFVAT